MNVFILHKNGRPINSNYDDLLDGFSWRGFNVIPFETQQIYTLNNTKEDIICAGIPLTHIALKYLGISIPKPIDIPTELLPYTKRKIWTEPYNDVLKRFLSGTQDTPIFIKPYNIHKLFTGLVINSVKDLINVPDAAKDTTVLCSEVINIVSEYRLYINYRTEIIDARRYTGDFRKLPDFSLAEDIIKVFQNKPIAYSLDLGITDKNETVIVELNDAYCLGNYGMSSDKYSKMVENRWMEIVGIPENIQYN
jgi:hypothetical protein